MSGDPGIKEGMERKLELLKRRDLPGLGAACLC